MAAHFATEDAQAVFILLHRRFTLRWVRHDSAAQIFNVLYRKAPANLGVGTIYLRRCLLLQRAKGLRDTGMSRLRRRNRMCSSRVSGTAYRQGNGSTLCSPTEEKILCRTPIFAAVAGLWSASGFPRERGRFTRRRKPQVVSFLCPRRAGDTPAGVSGTGIFIHPV